MSEILIKNGRIWDGEAFLKADILISSGKISDISESIQKSAEYTYDAAGKIVSAGLVDTHIHMKGISSDMFGVSADLATIPFGVTAAADASAAFFAHLCPT